MHLHSKSSTRLPSPPILLAQHRLHSTSVRDADLTRAAAAVTSFSRLRTCERGSEKERGREAKRATARTPRVKRGAREASRALADSLSADPRAAKSALQLQRQQQARRGRERRRETCFACRIMQSLPRFSRSCDLSRSLAPRTVRLIFLSLSLSNPRIS